VTEINHPLDVVARCRLGQGQDPCLDEWRAGHGVYTTSGFLATLLTRSSDAAPLADLQIFAVPTDARGYYPGYSKDSALAKDRFTWLVLKAHTKNKDGQVRLASASPFVRPHIAFNSFDEALGLADPDLRAVVTAIQRARTIVDRAQDALAGDTLTEVWPGRSVATDDDLASFVFKEHWGHHACCTDKMGTPDDPSAVVDSHFRVIGAEHLRVVDASVFPEIPGTFIALPTYMLSEKAAEVILEDDP
jgi:choline dehydrogenase